MELSELIEFKVNFEKNLDRKLLEFDCFFQDHMWDGYSEDKGQFVTDEDFEAIQALSDKIRHMILNIGCPLSVGEMLISISERKIKYWGSCLSEYNGRQLKTKSDRAMVINSCRYEKLKSQQVIKGHFRWNHRAYTLSRQTTDLLRVYITNNGF